MLRTENMNPQNSSGCSNCHQASLLPISRENWGSCPFCMALAVAGSVMGWSFTLSFWLLYPDLRITAALACLAVCITLVLLLHVIAYGLRAAKQKTNSSQTSN
jgi:hypothetical protein